MVGFWPIAVFQVAPGQSQPNIASIAFYTECLDRTLHKCQPGAMTERVGSKRAKTASIFTKLTIAVKMAARFDLTHLFRTKPLVSDFTFSHSDFKSH
jgi:hypothetical protein